MHPPGGITVPRSPTAIVRKDPPRITRRPRAAPGPVGFTPTADAQAQQPAASAAAPASPGYAFLNIEEAAFVEALVDHMVPADDLTPKGTDIGLHIYIDRALAGGWGKGER